MTKAKFYKCFSINQLRFLKLNGLKVSSRGTHPTTKRDFWVFESSNKLSQLLTYWTKNS